MTHREFERRRKFVSAVHEESVTAADMFFRRERLAGLMLRHAVSHHRIAEALCGDIHTTYWEKRGEFIERRINEIASELGLSVRFDGDPRGYTVKVFFPSGRHNTWGGEESGYGI